MAENKVNQVRVLVSELTAAEQKVLTKLVGTDVSESEAVNIRLAKASKQPRPCGCGCGSETNGGLFRPGHDAKLVSQALLGHQPSVERVASFPALQAKLDARVAAREAKKAAKLAELSQDELD